MVSARESNPCTAKMGAKQIQGRALSKLEETLGNTHRVQQRKSDNQLTYVKPTLVKSTTIVTLAQASKLLYPKQSL